jgi:hypothetical protein
VRHGSSPIQFWRYQQVLEPLFNEVKTVAALRERFRLFAESDELWDAIEAVLHHIKEDDRVQARMKKAVLNIMLKKKKAQIQKTLKR